MRKFLLLFCLLLTSLSGTASDIEIGGIYYNFDNLAKTATVTFRGDEMKSYIDEYVGEVVIPDAGEITATTS